MLTDFGKMLRKLRIDRQILLKDMAQVLDVSSAYLSAVETGKRKIPDSWVDTIAHHYEVNAQSKADLVSAFVRSAQEIKISLVNTSEGQRDAVLSFAKALNGLDDDKLARIMSIVQET